MTTTTNTDDPRFRRSFDALIATVTTLLDKNPLHKLSISSIVTGAGVTRPTFYQHFRDVQAVAQRAALVRLETAFAEADEVEVPSSAEDVVDLGAVIRITAIPVLDHLLTYEHFYLTVFDQAGTAAFFDEVVGFIAGNLLPDADAERMSTLPRDEQDRLTVLGAGCMWLVVRWLKSPASRDTAPQMAERLACTVEAMMRDAR